MIEVRSFGCFAPAKRPIPAFALHMGKGKKVACGCFGENMFFSKRPQGGLCAPDMVTEALRLVREGEQKGQPRSVSEQRQKKEKKVFFFFTAGLLLGVVGGFLAGALLF